jgi:hypothetical protein
VRACSRDVIIDREKKDAEKRGEKIEKASRTERTKEEKRRTTESKLCSRNQLFLGSNEFIAGIFD